MTSLTKNLPKISETEWEVMRVLWAKSPLPAEEIIAQLAAQDDWHPKTAKTLLSRLVKKKALGFEKEGRAYLYRPLVREVDCVKAVSDSFLHRVFGGSLTPMLAHFVEHKKMSAAELRELKRLLDQKD
jgi:BlaI family penicillinase repressor